LNMENPTRLEHVLHDLVGSMIGSQERECSTCECSTCVRRRPLMYLSSLQISGKFGLFARIVFPTPLYQGSRPTWGFVRKLWPQTINGYAFEQVTHLLTFKWLFPGQHLIAHKSETVHVCFEGGAQLEVVAQLHCPSHSWRSRTPQEPSSCEYQYLMSGARIWCSSFSSWTTRNRRASHLGFRRHTSVQGLL
jgi:hypothetical protein